MKMKNLTKLLLALMLAVVFATGAFAEGDSGALTEEQLEARIAEKAEEISKILSDEDGLWGRLFNVIGTEINLIYEGKSFSQQLAEGIEANKSLYTEEELKKLEADLEEIKRIEREWTALEEQRAQLDTVKYPSTEVFPSFEGADLDGNVADEGLFQKNAVTVVNFWFSDCNACVEELDKLNALNETLKARGGEVIGMNTDTFDGKEEAIETAKRILKSKGAGYRNIWVADESDAAMLAYSQSAFPVTYVVDRIGNIVGSPILGSIDNPAIMEQLQKLIDTAIQWDERD